MGILRTWPEFKGSWLRASDGTAEENITYVTKSGAPCVRHGEPMRQGARSDLQEVVNQVLNGSTTTDQVVRESATTYHQYGRTLLAAQEIHLRNVRRANKPRAVIWLWGATGLGKSRLARLLSRESTLYEHVEDGMWWDNYTGERTVLLDDFQGHINFRTFLRLTDRYPTRVPKRSQAPFPFLADTIIVTSDRPPTDCWPSLTTSEMAQLTRRISDARHLTTAYEPSQEEAAWELLQTCPPASPASTPVQHTTSLSPTQRPSRKTHRLPATSSPSAEAHTRTSAHPESGSATASPHAFASDTEPSDSDSQSTDRSSQHSATSLRQRRRTSSPPPHTRKPKPKTTSPQQQHSSMSTSDDTPPRIPRAIVSATTLNEPKPAAPGLPPRRCTRRIIEDDDPDDTNNPVFLNSPPPSPVSGRFSTPLPSPIVVDALNPAFNTPLVPRLMSSPPSTQAALHLAQPVVLNTQDIFITPSLVRDPELFSDSEDEVQVGIRRSVYGA